MVEFSLLVVDENRSSYFDSLLQRENVNLKLESYSSITIKMNVMQGAKILKKYISFRLYKNAFSDQ